MSTNMQDISVCVNHCETTLLHDSYLCNHLRHIGLNKPPRRFAPCRLDPDDVLDRSSRVMYAISVSAVIVCTHLKYNNCHMSQWPKPHPSVICVEFLWGSRQPMTGRLPAHPSNTKVKIQMPNSHCPTRRDSTRPSRRVGSGGVDWA